MNLSCRPCCQASSLRVSSTPPGAEPALLTKMSMRPKCFCAPSTKALASASLVRSAGIASALRPLALRISSAVFSSGSLRRAQIATSQPSRASAAAMPLPMPSLPPVMHAILPLSCRSMALLPDWLVLYCEKYSPHRDKSTKSAKAPPHRWSRKLAQGAQPARLLRAGASGGLDRDAGALDPRADEHGHRYVALLREFGFLMEAPGGKYALGPRALSMARAAQAALSYTELAHPLMETLSHDTGETVFLLRRVGDHAICIGRCDPVNPVRIFLELGSSVPLHVGASPKLLLAHLPPRERDAYLARYIERDPALRRNRARLRAELEHIRAHGSGITIDEITPGVWACAAPIVEHGKVVAALSVAGPAFRIGKAKRSAFEALVRNAARAVSAGIENRHGVT